MGSLLVGAAGLMWGGHVAVAGPGSGGGLGAVAPAAWGDCGVGTNRGLILSREVNDLIWTPEALAYFDCYFLRFYSANPAVLRSKGVDVLGLRFYSFTSREKY